MEKSESDMVSKKFVYQPGWQRITLLSILGYETAGALSGGILPALAPDGRLMDMPVDIMHGFFKDFFIPGFMLIGLGILHAADEKLFSHIEECVLCIQKNRRK